MQFETDSNTYDRGRPEYPQKVVDCLSLVFPILPNSTVLELGVGTGKFTKLLLECGVRIIALEPLENMRTKFSQIFPTIQILDGVAESIPLPDNSVDHVIVAQAFHWFDGNGALREIHRVLKPKGNLGLVWNLQDRDHDWVEKLAQIVDANDFGTPQYRKGEWRKSFSGLHLFSPLQEIHFQHSHPSTPEMVIDRVASISFISMLDEMKRKEVLRQVRGLLENHPDIREKTLIHFPYKTDVFFCHKV
jgi:SAM-dependent methyltransferase